jgi:hypothetical protein
MRDLPIVASNLPHGSGIPGGDRVRGQKQEAFDCSLRDEHAIERIFIDRRQIGGSGAKIAAAEARFDRDLPQACRTEQQSVPVVGEHFAGGGGQTLGLPRAPIAGVACRVAGSPARAEHPFNFSLAHPVEVAGHVNLSGHETQPADLTGWGCFERYDLDDRFGRLGDDEGLALGGAIDEPREVRLGLVNVDAVSMLQYGLSLTCLIRLGSFREAMPYGRPLPQRAIDAIEEPRAVLRPVHRQPLPIGALPQIGEKAVAILVKMQERPPLQIENAGPHLAQRRPRAQARHQFAQPVERVGPGVLHGLSRFFAAADDIALRREAGAAMAVDGAYSGLRLLDLGQGEETPSRGSIRSGLTRIARPDMRRASRISGETPAT